MPRARVREKGRGEGGAQRGRSACRCPLVATVLLHASLTHSIRFRAVIILSWFTFTFFLPSPPSSSESATSCGRQRIKYRARYRGGREGRRGQLKCAVGVGATFFVFFLGSLQTISGLSFICIKKYLHSTVNEIKSGVGGLAERGEGRRKKCSNVRLQGIKQTV